MSLSGRFIRQEESEGVDHDVAFAADDLLGGVDALVGGWDVAGGLDVLGVDHAARGLGGAAPWRQLPADFPPWQTVCWYFVRWEKQRVTLLLLGVVQQRVRRVDGRGPSRRPASIDSRGVQAAGTVGRSTRGYDVGKKVAGRKRFIITDTLGLLVSPARGA